MRYISATLCHFSFRLPISLLLRETMPTRFPRLRLPRHTMSANRKKIPATMKPNIFTLSFFITPHHTLLLIPAHNPPPRSFTPTPCNPHSLHFPAPTPAITTPPHYLTTLTPYILLLHPCSLQPRPTTLQLSLPPLYCSYPCSLQPRPLPCSFTPTPYSLHS